MVKPSRKKQFRFSPAKDIKLLKVALEFRPWEFGLNLWGDVANKLKGELQWDVTNRTCRSRVEGLLTAFQKKDMSCLRRSGTEEEYNERDELLQKLTDLFDSSEICVLADVASMVGNGVTGEESWASNEDGSQSIIVEDVDTPCATLTTSPTAIKRKKLGAYKLVQADKSLADQEIQEEMENEFGDESTLAAEPTRIRKKRLIDIVALLDRKYALDVKEQELKERQLAFEEKKLEMQVEQNRCKAELEKQRMELEDRRLAQHQEVLNKMMDVLSRVVNNQHVQPQPCKHT